MSLDVMKQALEALEFLALENFVELDKSLNVGPTHGRKAILALRAAIEQAEKQEPVAWYDSKTGWTDFHAFKPVRQPSAPDAEWLPLYTAPRQWQGLTKKEFLAAVDGLEDLEDCWVAIEAKLKEKNA